MEWEYGIWNMDMYVCTVTTKTKPSLGGSLRIRLVFSRACFLKNSIQYLSWFFSESLDLNIASIVFV